MEKYQIAQTLPVEHDKVYTKIRASSHHYRCERCQVRHLIPEYIQSTFIQLEILLVLGLANLEVDVMLFQCGIIN